MANKFAGLSWSYPSTAMCLLAIFFISRLHGSEPDSETKSFVRVGFVERDISPRLGMERPGNYFKQYHTAFHDPCKVRAVVFDNGLRCCAIVSVDALMIGRPQVQLVRKKIAESIDIEPQAILIAATHSHSSGPTGMVLPGQYDHADKITQQLAYQESSTADPEYLLHVERQIIDAVLDAYQKRDRAQIGFASGIEEGVSFNRRFQMRNGRTQTNPRPGNPNRVKTAGPIDPEVAVIGVWSTNHQLLGCIVSFACHATASPVGISANYIYYLEKQIRSIMGDNVVLVFLAGASGDVVNVDNLSEFEQPDGETSGKLVGSQVGAEATKQLLRMGTTNQVTLNADSRELRIARRVSSADRVAKARETIQNRSNDRNAEWTFAKETILAADRASHEPIAIVEVQAIQLGPAVFVTTPAEYFCQFGLDQKLAIHFPLTIPVSLANGCVGYVPTEEAFSERGGGYETRLTSYSNLVPTAGRTMADAGIELANQFTPDPVTMRKAAPAFTGDWDYGSNPAEVE